MPSITAPASIQADEDERGISVSGISITDAADSDILTITLSAEGQLSLGQITGLRFTGGDGTNNYAMTFTGTVANINAALAGLKYATLPDDDDGDVINVNIVNFDLDQLEGGDGTQGFIIEASRFFDLVGRTVSFAGDVNGDGIDDLLIGTVDRTAYAYSPTDSDDTGEAYLVFGSDQGFSPTLDLDDIINGDGSIGFVINGVDPNDYAGSSVSSAGDVNGDGIDDLIIGAREGDPNGNDNAGEIWRKPRTILTGWNQRFCYQWHQRR